MSKKEGLKVPETSFYGTGRRKEAIARVWIFKGDGQFQVNGRVLDDYFPSDMLKGIATSPLATVGQQGSCTVKATVKGGGVSGQAGALRLGVARALLAMDSSVKPVLKQHAHLVRNAQVKERHKYGKRGARKSPQFRKR